MSWRSPYHLNTTKDRKVASNTFKKKKDGVAMPVLLHQDSSFGCTAYMHPNQGPGVEH